MDYPDTFDVIVIGGGHAGTEAALASARMGCSTLLLTHNIETLGQMSCNPAIGGIGKSHLVKEIDALGGAMALATDKAGIQFRILNARKGPAVRATRAQADRVLYKAAVREILEGQEQLAIFQQAADDLIIDGDQIRGVVTQTGLRFMASTVVLTTGTFLGGKIHIGLDNHSGGRAGDPPSIALADRLREMPLNVGRLKTGTPPRIDARSVDFTDLQEQPGDTPRPVMSYMGCVEQHPEQVLCHITHTNERTHDLIRAGLDRSPLYGQSGKIEGTGPRYCPALEDKVVRFADKNSHQIFIEPEGINTNELYPNGISTSLPFDVQMEFVRSIKGFERAHITRPGYAIEYDFFDPRDLRHSLETKFIGGLFFAGQINGTTGYEEAAAQGLIAGMNAALKCQSKEAWYPRRDEAYIGVLIDDLITLGTSEPYRMFTSRAEYRLLLREDNADRRLTEKGRELGLVNDLRWDFYNNKMQAIEAENNWLSSSFVQANSSAAKNLEAHLTKPLSHEHKAAELLKRPELTLSKLCDAFERRMPDRAVAEQVEVDIKYQGYIDRQAEDIARLKRSESVSIPEDFDFSQVGGLSNEVQQKLFSALPQTLGQAGRIPGVTPAAVSQLLIFLKKSSVGVARATAK